MGADRSDEIMAATYRALCEHGFAALTMQDIADETETSKAALHYHYDTKQDLLLSFLDYLYDQITARIDKSHGATPPEHLQLVIDNILRSPERNPDPKDGFATAMLELKAQAPYDPGIRDRMEAIDSYLVETISEIIHAGIEAGEFAPVDPEETARFIVTAVDGAWTKHVAIDRDLACTRRGLTSFIETHLETTLDLPETAESDIPASGE